MPLYVWADIEYGGFNILAQLRRDVSPNFVPYKMDIDTLEGFIQYARPLTEADRHNLERQLRHGELQVVHPTIHDMLKRGVKLEQEAIELSGLANEVEMMVER